MGGDPVLFFVFPTGKSRVSNGEIGVTELPIRFRSLFVNIDQH